MSGAKSDRVKSLEAQIKDLRGKLEAKETQIKIAAQTKSEKELFLESQVLEEKRKIESIENDIAMTTERVKDVQNKLTSKEAQLVEERLLAEEKRKKVMEEKRELIEAVAAAAVGQKEKDLQKMLEKAKDDKEKAIRVLIKIAGKDRVADFLSVNAGAPDLLDRLEEMLLGRNHCSP